MAGELQPTLGDIRPHGHLKLGRFTQHFVDVLDLSMTPLEYFESKYPDDAREEQRKYLGRFGLSGAMQVQKMAELSDGQKSRVVFAKLGRDIPHILLLDEPTNHLDMESIDALAKAVNEFKGGMVLVSHDMRLISQVAKEIWICDNKKITKYQGDILNFKMDMREQMGIDGEPKGSTLRGDASVKKKTDSELLPAKKSISTAAAKLEVTAPPSKTNSMSPTTSKLSATQPTSTSSKDLLPFESSPLTVAATEKAEIASTKKYIPMHLRATATADNGDATNGISEKVKYIPPHLRK
jgi:ATP-binding cassette, subfamily F, member 2